jgi:hypothetical protein
MSVPAASSAFYVAVSRQHVNVHTIRTHVFGISHVCDLSKWLDSELRWCRGVVVGRRSWRSNCRGPAGAVSRLASDKTWHGPCSIHGYSNASLLDSIMCDSERIAECKL